jgi:signal transduction histidine kinase
LLIEKVVYYQYFIIGLIHLVLGYLALRPKYKDQVNFAFFFLSLSFTAWIVSLHFLNEWRGQSKENLLFIGRLVFASCSLGPVNLFHFAIAYKQKKNQITSLLIFYGIGLIFLFLSFTPLVLKNVIIESWGLLPITGILYPIFLLYFLSFFFLTGISLIFSYRKSVGVRKSQLQYFLIGFFIFILFVTLTNLILPTIGFKDIYRLGPWGSVVFMSFTVYSILKYRLMEIEILLKKSTFYFLAISFIVGLYVLFIFILPNLFLHQSTKKTFSIFNLIVFSALLSFSFPYFQNYFDDITNKIFFRKRYKPEELIKFISRQFNLVVRFQDFELIFNEIFKKHMHLNNYALFLIDHQKKDLYTCKIYFSNQPHAKFDTIDTDDPLIVYLKENRGLLDAEQFKHEYTHASEKASNLDLEKMKIYFSLNRLLESSIVMPIFVKDSLQGFLSLGRKMSEEPFFRQDISLIEIFCRQLGLVLENVQLYEQMLNRERLSIIGTMAAGIAHEIRNPLASIKTFIQMLPNKHHNPEFMQRFLEIVPSEIERLSGITADLLNFSRPSSPNIETIQINQICERVLTLLGGKIRKKNLQVEKKFEDLPPIAADGQQLSQVLLNLMLNAVQAAPIGGWVGLRTFIPLDAPSRQSSGPSHVQVVVYDNGPGIKRDDLENVFQPFFTTKTEGTGLGLATCRRIVEAHSGLIWAESPPGKGAHLNVLLPIAKVMPTEEFAVKNI